jgi:hypothetical protein
MTASVRLELQKSWPSLRNASRTTMSVLNELLKSFGLTMTATLIVAAIFAIVIVFWLWRRA